MHMKVQIRNLNIINIRLLSLKKRNNVVKEPNDAPKINLLLLTFLLRIYATVISKTKSETFDFKAGSCKTKKHRR